MKLSHIFMSCTLLLAGCVTLPEQPEVRTVTNTVQVPVAVPCFKESDRPIKPQPTPIDAATASTEQLAAAELADAVAEKDYTDQIDRLFLQCKGSTP